jgi:cytochrome c553
MGPIARAVSDEDVREAAAYFAAITPTPFVKVIEAATAPKTYVSADARHRRIHPDGGTEPIGRRIIQIPEDPMRTTIRDPHSGFIAYVPPGSIAKGAALAKAGDAGKTIQCALCHGDALTGLRRGAADCGPAAGLHRAAAHDDAERHERRRQRSADEKGRRESVGRRHHRALRVPGIASAPVIGTPTTTVQTA